MGWSTIQYPFLGGKKHNQHLSPIKKIRILMKTRRSTTTTHPPPPPPAAVQSPKCCPKLFWRWQCQRQGQWLWWWRWCQRQKMLHPPRRPPGRPPRHRGEGGFLPHLWGQKWEGGGWFPPGGQGQRWRWRWQWRGSGISIGIGRCRIPRGSLLEGLLVAAGGWFPPPYLAGGMGDEGIAPPWGDGVGGGNGSVVAVAVAVAVGWWCHWQWQGRWQGRWRW
jgi:hypothetical protein